ncbi:SMI1/KNR4 family protein [Savagea faecisuis]|uniref:SMI1/KNR4 family protein n=1 Tax=Savagea faecisuis TaxID=1274803 RepID=A0ABW3H0H5_9BACL
MEWKYTIALEDETLIEKFESTYDVKFPASFIQIVKQYNAGYPTPPAYGDQEAKALLSFNPTDDESIWEAMKQMQEARVTNVVPFMNDDFGNYICFYEDPLEDEQQIVFIDSERDHSMKVIAENFDAFLALFR